MVGVTVTEFAATLKPVVVARYVDGLHVYVDCGIEKLHAVFDTAVLELF